jgi:hypothetical protein
MGVKAVLSNEQAVAQVIEGGRPSAARVASMLT